MTFRCQALARALMRGWRSFDGEDTSMVPYRTITKFVERGSSGTPLEVQVRDVSIECYFQRPTDI